MKPYLSPLRERSSEHRTHLVSSTDGRPFTLASTSGTPKRVMGQLQSAEESIPRSCRRQGRRAGFVNGSNGLRAGFRVHDSYARWVSRFGVLACLQTIITRSTLFLAATSNFCEVRPSTNAFEIERCAAACRASQPHPLPVTQRFVFTLPDHASEVPREDWLSLGLTSHTA